MTWWKLLRKIEHNEYSSDIYKLILLGIVKLHKPQEITLPNGHWGENCKHCNNGWTYPCLTVQVIMDTITIENMINK